MFFVFHADEKYIPQVHSRPMMAGIDRNGHMCWDEPTVHVDNETLQGYRDDLHYERIATHKGKGI